MVTQPKDTHPRGRRRGFFLMALLSLLIGGCAARTSMSKSDSAGMEYAELAGRQRSELVSYAALLRVKMWHEGRIDDFRAEVFSECDSLLSIYVRGFLGKSAFKALVKGDSLLVYFPAEHKYFSGRRQDVETGELRNTRHVVDFLFALLHGYTMMPDSAHWTSEVTRRRDRVGLTMDDRERGCTLRIDLSANDRRFPFQQLKALELRTSSGKLRVSIQVQSSKFNRAVPAEKFSIDLPTTATAIDQNRLVEMLTGVAP